MASKALLILSALYACSWIITLCGLAATADWCYDKMNDWLNRVGYAGGSVFAWELGSCGKFFAFAWWIWCFSTFAPLLSFVSAVVPDFHGAALGLYYVLTPLMMLLTSAFYNLQSIDGIDSTGETRLEVTVAGFALQTVFAICIIVSAPLINAGRDERDLSPRDKPVAPPRRAEPAVV